MSRKSKKSDNIFKFKKTDHIGAAGAEDDHEFLSNCFVDTGDFAVLEKLTDHRQILLGRAGSGKTALISRLKSLYKDNVITIDPEGLALTYVSNSTILHFFSELGVNLDPFFKLLWRHVLTVEILNKHVPPTSDKKFNLFDSLSRMFSGNSKKDQEMKEAIEYLRKWGKSFWEKTEYRVREITNVLETDLGAAISANLGIKPAQIKSAFNVSSKITEEQKAELISRGQIIVSEAQVQDLHKVSKLLKNVLSDRHKKYYVVIDGLDEDWVEENLRYKLIKALISTTRDFTKIPNVKIVIALRRDLIEQVFRYTRDSGFQEEKYQSLYIRLNWEKSDLIEVLNKRIDYLVSRRYTKNKPVTHKDLLPKQYKGIEITDLLQRITLRPRDIIALFNTCILKGANLKKLSTKELKEAIGEYSRSRLSALSDEWNNNYPSLITFTKILRKRPHSFKLNTIKDKDIEDLCLEVASANPDGEGVLQEYAQKVVDMHTSFNDCKILIINIFYKVGLVGIKTIPHEPEVWVDEIGVSTSKADVDLETSIIVHPMYHRALGIDPYHS